MTLVNMYSRRDSLRVRRAWIHGVAQIPCVCGRKKFRTVELIEAILILREKGPAILILPDGDAQLSRPAKTVRRTALALGPPGPSP